MDPMEPPAGAVTTPGSAGPAAPAAKVTAVARYTYTNTAHRPTETVVKWHRRVGDEQPVVRKLAVKADKWTPLETYWLETASLLLVENKGPDPVTLGRSVPGAAEPVPLVSVPPDEAAAFRPQELAGWLVKAWGRESSVLVTIYPG